MSSISRRKYSVTRGADFSNDESMVDYERAPICENIIPDHAGYPEKRPGWRVENEYEGKIYGLHKYTFGGITKMLVHEGTRLWCDDELLCEDMAESISRSYQNENDLIILDGENYRVFKDNTGVAYGVPWLNKKDNTVTLDYHGAESVDRVGIVYVGSSYYDSEDYEEILKKGLANSDVNGESGITEYLNPADGQIFELQTEGWYFVIADSEEKQYIKQFYVAQPLIIEAGVPYFEVVGNKAVLRDNNSDYMLISVKWGYQGKTKGTTLSCQEHSPEDGSEYELYSEGFYYFYLEEWDFEQWRYSKHYLYYEKEKTKYKLFNVSSEDTLYDIDSGKLYTDNGAYIPTTTINNTCLAGGYDDSVTGEPITANGTAYEKVNKLTAYRRMTVLGGAENDYVLDGALASDCIGESITYSTISVGSIVHEVVGNHVHNMVIFVNGKRYERVLLVESVNISTTNKDRITALGYDWVIYRGKKGADGYTSSILRFLGKNTVLAPQVTGRDNIEIYYVAEADEDTDISKCTGISEYDNNLFVTGNPDKPNFDWHSYVENPYYFPDLNYQKFGDNTAVLGYVNTGEYQAIVKADGAAGGSIYIRSVAEFNGERAYPVKQMASGVGGVSKDGFCSLIGDDLILTRQGIFAFTTIDMTGEKTLSNRSWYVDGKLCKENLQNANMFVWQGKCFCAVEDRVYILNAESSMSRNHKYDTLYDCYFWTGIPMNRVLVVNDELYFSNGSKLCKLNTDVEGVGKYNDDGEPIVARWGTKLDDDEDITRYKTMIKRGNTVTVKPFTRSSATVYLRTEKDNGKKVKEGITDIFDWKNIDFSRISFDGTDTLREIIVNTKVKKYKRLQFVVENAVVNEGFGITEINKHYVYGNFIKR